MPLATRHPNNLLISDLQPNVPGELSHVPSFAEEGFDELVTTHAVLSSLGAQEAVLAAFFPKGKPYGSATMWLVKASARAATPGLWIAEITWKGRFGPAVRYTRRYDAQVKQASMSNAQVVAPTGYPFTYPAGSYAATANEGALTVRTSYVTTTMPDFSKVSETVYSGNPLPAGYPALPDPPASKFLGIPEPAYNYPAGWVLDARPTESIRDISGAEVCWHVQDIHTWYHQKRPGG